MRCERLVAGQKDGKRAFRPMVLITIHQMALLTVAATTNCSRCGTAAPVMLQFCSTSRNYQNLHSEAILCFSQGSLFAM